MDFPDADAPEPRYGVRNVDFSFGAHPVLRNITFSVRPGEIHALVGHHNEGKSTLCGILTGRLAPDAGHVVAAGSIHPHLNPIQARDLGIAGLSNRSNVYPRRTVLQNLVSEDSAVWLGLWPERRQRRRVGEWLKDNNISLPLSLPLHELPHEMWVVVETLAKLYRNPGLLVMDGALEELTPAALAPLMALIRRHLAKGMGFLIVTHKIEDALDMADRVTVMRRGHVIVTNSALDMERLSLIRLCYAQLDDDADERFSSQEKFQELMRYTEAMLRDLPVAVVILSMDQHIRFVNRAGRRLFAEAVAGGDDALFGGENARLREAVTETTASGRDGELHGVPVVSGSRRVLANVKIQAIRENNVRVGIMVTMEDISMREKLRRRIVLSEQLSSIGLLAAGVAHEVNNPLEIIGNYLNYLRDDPSSPDAGEVISNIEDEVARIQEIVDNLVASTDKGREKEAVDVMATVREIAALLGFHGGFKNVRFVMADPPRPAFVRINPSEFRQVVVNLIRNAIDAMSGSGSIRIDCSPDPADGSGGAIILRFVDSGPGIPLDNPNDVFLPFTTTKKGNGAHQGLGLYIVYGIMEKYGGGVSVRNLPEGGCEFSLRLPAIPQ